MLNILFDLKFKFECAFMVSNIFFTQIKIVDPLITVKQTKNKNLLFVHLIFRCRDDSSNA